MTRENWLVGKVVRVQNCNEVRRKCRPTLLIGYTVVKYTIHKEPAYRIHLPRGLNPNDEVNRYRSSSLSLPSTKIVPRR